MKHAVFWLGSGGYGHGFSAIIIIIIIIILIFELFAILVKTIVRELL
jgi:hypothetical protein